MNAHRIEVLDRADDDDVVGPVADDLQLVLLPADDRLFDQHLVDRRQFECDIDEDEALNRVNGAQLAQLMFPKFDENATKKQIAKGVNASPGAAVGKVVFDSHTAAEWAARGEDVILVRRETNPDDLPGMIAGTQMSKILSMVGSWRLLTGPA